MTLQPRGRITFAVLLWVLWSCHNRLVFYQNEASITDIQAQLCSTLRDLKEMLRLQPPRPVAPLSVAWVPPDPGFLKLNMDASVKHGWGSAIGGVVRSSSGGVEWCFAEQLDGLFAVDISEAMAIREGMTHARRKGIQNLIVESDSQVVINAILKPLPDLSYLGGVVREILEMQHLFSDIRFSWTRRPGNLVAHKLALFGFSCLLPFFSTCLSGSIVYDVETDAEAN
ncbi:hypothetical protein ACS0TY_023270 [Phlomoides rotata]